MLKVCNNFHIGKDVHVITGRGIHSKGREARIKPAVIQYLQHRGYTYVCMPL